MNEEEVYRNLENSFDRVYPSNIHRFNYIIEWTETNIYIRIDIDSVGRSPFKYSILLLYVHVHS